AAADDDPRYPGHTSPERAEDIRIHVVAVQDVHLLVRQVARQPPALPDGGSSVEAVDGKGLHRDAGLLVAAAELAIGTEQDDRQAHPGRVQVLGSAHGIELRPADAEVVGTEDNPDGGEVGRSLWG